MSTRDRPSGLTVDSNGRAALDHRRVLAVLAHLGRQS